MKPLLIGLVFLITVQFTHLANAPAQSIDAITPGEFTVEPPTLLCAGFEWKMQGDGNRNSEVEVGYRKKDATVWEKDSFTT